MEIAKSTMLDLAFKLNELQNTCGITNNTNNFDDEFNNNENGIHSLNFGLSAVVYEWARGKPFKDIVQMIQVQEGSIVRCITRLDELCRDFRNAARIIGNASLYRKMEAASQCIKRDIVFAASLYFS